MIEAPISPLTVSPLEEERADDRRETEEEHKECEGETEEGRNPRFRNPPSAPTAQERAAHEVTHVPFRQWCKQCVAGRGTSHGHRKQKNGEEKTKIGVHLDYWSMRDYAGATKMSQRYVTREIKSSSGEVAVALSTQARARERTLDERKMSTCLTCG